MLNDQIRVGIYGGTFAPVHNGHIAAYFDDTAGLTDEMMGEYMLGLKKQSKEEVRRVCHD